VLDQIYKTQIFFFQVDIFSYDLIIVPVHLGVHWCMAAIDFGNKTVKYYNSMGSGNNKCLEVDEIFIFTDCDHD
jgi:sentrin-specific protease 1